MRLGGAGLLFPDERDAGGVGGRRGRKTAIAAEACIDGGGMSWAGGRTGVMAVEGEGVVRVLGARRSTAVGDGGHGAEVELLE